MHTNEMHTAIIAIRTANQAADHAIEHLLTLARHTDPTDRESTNALLEAAELIGHSEQARHGQLIQLLAQADRVKACKGGLAPWITTHLDASPGRSRAIAQCARRIGHLPELATPLSSGQVGTDTIRTLTRTARAIEHTDHDQAAVLAETLEVTAREGITAANRRVRELEESLDPGHAQETLTKQRARSFARVTETDTGMCRIEALLDPVRATTLRAAIDQQSAAWIRARQFDPDDPLPEDVRTVEQIQAHALTRLAEVFLETDPAQREAVFTPATLYTATLEPTNGERLAESAYGQPVPRSALAPTGHHAAHLIHHDNTGTPLLLDGQPIDTDPALRLATGAQRIALAARDRHCTFPGCTRPPTWSLHVHHQIPYSRNGPTTLGNLTLLCAQHHTLTHHPDPHR